MNTTITVLFIVPNIDGEPIFYKGLVRKNQLLSQQIKEFIRYTDRDRKYFDHYRVDVFIHEDASKEQMRDAHSYVSDLQYVGFWDNNLTSVNLYHQNPPADKK